MDERFMLKETVAGYCFVDFNFHRLLVRELLNCFHWIDDRFYVLLHLCSDHWGFFPLKCLRILVLLVVLLAVGVICLLFKLCRQPQSTMILPQVWIIY